MNFMETPIIFTKQIQLTREKEEILDNFTTLVADFNSTF